MILQKWNLQEIQISSQFVTIVLAEKLEKNRMQPKETVFKLKRMK